MVVLWKILFDSHGFVNSAIHALSGISGIGQILNVLSVREVDWMNTDAAFGILVFSYVWKYLGYDIVLWMAGHSAIPQGIYEEEEVDGFFLNQIVENLMAQPLDMLNRLCSLVADFQEPEPEDK